MPAFLLWSFSYLWHFKTYLTLPYLLWPSGGVWWRVVHFDLVSSRSAQEIRRCASQPAPSAGNAIIKRNSGTSHTPRSVAATFPSLQADSLSSGPAAAHREREKSKEKKKRENKGSFRSWNRIAPFGQAKELYGVSLSITHLPPFTLWERTELFRISSSVSTYIRTYIHTLVLH